MKPLSIGMFCYSTLPRGSVVHGAHVAEALQRLGADVTLYALSKERAPFYRDVACRLELVPAAALQGGGEQLVRQRIEELTSYLVQHRPEHDVFHAQDCLTASALLDVPYSNARSGRTVHHVEDYQNPYLNACQTRSIAQASALCVVSRATQAVVAKDFGRSVTLVGNGIVDRTTAARSRDTLSWRKRLLRGRQGPLLLSFGGVEERKNALNVLHAVSLLQDRFPGLVWVIAGGASVLEHSRYRAQFMTAWQAAPDPAAIVELGVVSEADVGALLCAADVAVVASQQEGFGLAALEAAAAGVPVVVSQGAPFSEYLDDTSAWFVAPADPSSIAQGIAGAVAAPTEKQYAARRAAARHTWRAVAERYLNTFQQRRALQRDAIHA